ncbi:YceI family protein [Antarcticibacterium sp. 1MA-6-2]|uniref:YceI family protein n=1 Tax=Antarcticibacterium sp. 1MA-6-2 TaxID=2908210 RepID=UPI001F1BFA7A|nr:YceI family protein [Antarcticibacterium sp. 1MA-6-2]UJH89844.1 YceI family protein [Antarcticibacterium sp. 1MA-6-2]
MDKIVSIVFIAFMGAAVSAQTTWKPDKAHSQVSFAITHLGISEIEGSFDSFEATINATKEDFSDADYDVEIDASSINTGVGRRDDHLRNPDFFNVENNPKITFKGKATEKISDGKYKVSGDLTMNGVTKPVTLEIWHRGTIENQKGEKVAGLKITGKVNRSNFNLGPKFPEAVLSDEVLLEADGEFKKQ